MATITLENISYNYPDGTLALHGISAVIRPGEAVAVIGANGAGKTTLARLIKGILVPSRGRILIDDWDTALVPASIIASKIGYVFADPRLQIFTASVREEITFGPANLGWTPDKTAAALEKALEITALRDKADCHPYELSRSERKRLALASVLAMNCQAVILDEPTAGLDVQSYCCLQNALDWLRENGTAIIAVTHDMDFAADNFVRGLALQKGRLIQDGPLEAILAQAEKYGQEPPCAARLCRALQQPERYTGTEFLDLLNPLRN